MRVGWYWLEDHFEALSHSSRGRLARALAGLMSAVCASIGDAFAERPNARRLFTLPD